MEFLKHPVRPAHPLMLLLFVKKYYLFVKAIAIFTLTTFFCLYQIRQGEKEKFFSLLNIF